MERRAHLRNFSFALAAALLLAGCASSRPGGHLVLVGDTSGSFADQAGPVVDAMRGSVSPLRRSRDRLTVLRFAQDCQELSSEIPLSEQAFSDEMTSVFARPSTEAGTSFGAMLEGVDTAIQRRSEPAIVAVFTDGANDDLRPDAIARIDAAVHQLASNPRLVRISFCGVEPGRREWLRERLRPLADRLEFTDLSKVRMNLPQKEVKR